MFIGKHLLANAYPCWWKRRYAVLGSISSLTIIVCFLLHPHIMAVNKNASNTKHLVRKNIEQHMPTEGSCAPQERATLLNNTGAATKVTEFCGVKYHPRLNLFNEKQVTITPIPGVKNPCMFNPKGTGLICVPYLFLVGAPKCGTTELYKQLTRHPDFVPPKTKEPHWLSRGRFHYNQTYQDYLKIFYTAASSTIFKDFSKNRNKTAQRFISSLVTGDASATYLCDNDFWPILPENENRSEPCYTNADYIQRLNPAAKILITVRNPIDRLWSDYMAASKVKSADIFHHFVGRAIGYFQSCFKNRTVRCCVHDAHLHIQSTTNDSMKGFHKLNWGPKVWITCPTMYTVNVDLRVGLYSIYIKEFLRVFPRDQIYIQRLETYSADIAKTLQNVFTFLDMSELSSAKMVKMSNQTRGNERKLKDKNLGDMRNDTRKLLYQFYKPFNEKLANLLEDPEYNYGFH